MIGTASRRGNANPLVPVTAVGLVVVVAVPFLFVVLQAIFPELGRGSLAGAFSRVAATLGDARLLGMAANTLVLGLGGAALSAIIAVPLAVVRALFRLPGAAVWDVLFIVPFMIPPYISTLGWIMTLQPRGYLFQLVGFDMGWRWPS